MSEMGWVVHGPARGWNLGYSTNRSNVVQTAQDDSMNALRCAARATAAGATAAAAGEHPPAATAAAGQPQEDAADRLLVAWLTNR